MKVFGVPLAVLVLAAYASYNLADYMALSPLPSAAVTSSTHGNATAPLNNRTSGGLLNIHLNASNLVILKGPIDSDSMAHLKQQIYELPSREHVVLYIDSPGGSVMAGNDFLQAMNTLKANGTVFTAVANRAASMAFILLQNCNNRYILENSILMQHSISLMLWNDLEKAQSYLKLVDSIKTSLVRMQAERMGMAPADFLSKTLQDWWFYQDEAIQSHAADRQVTISCDASLMQGGFGDNRCPLFM
jgi:ATP-dependent protease ClpP protease subunit